MIYLFGDCTLDTTRREFRRDGQPIKLEPRVYEVLVYLVRHRHRLVTKGELLQSVWAAETVQEGSLVRCISAVRRALGDSTRPQPYIVTHYGVGYRFQADVVEQASTNIAPTSFPVPPAAAAVPGGTAPVGPAGASEQRITVLNNSLFHSSLWT